MTFTFTIPALATQTTPAVLIPPEFVEGGGTAYLVNFNRVGNSFQFYIAATEDGTGFDTGPQMTAAWEEAMAAVTLQAPDNTTLTLSGPNNVFSTFKDDDEPYFWTPTTNTDIAAFYADHLNEAMTVVLDDDPSLLELSHYDVTRKEIVVLALIEAGARDNVYRSADNGGPVGSILDANSDLTIQTDQDVTRIAILNTGSSVRFWDNPSTVSLGGFFSGVGSDVHLEIQTGIITEPVRLTHNNSNPNRSVWNTPTADADEIHTIVEGERFIFALVRDLPYTGDATPVDFNFEVPAVTGVTIAPVAGDVDPITFSFEVPAATGSIPPPPTLPDSYGDFLLLAGTSSSVWRVWRYHAGTWDTGISTPVAITLPRGITMDTSNGDILVYNQTDRKIYRYNGTEWDDGTEIPASVGTLYGLSFDTINNQIITVDQFPASVYRYDGTTWSLVTTGPTGQHSARAVAFDPTNGDILVSVRSGSLLDKIFRYDGATWDVGIDFPDLPSGGSNEIGEGLAVDPATGNVILIREYDTSGNRHADIYRYDGTSWDEGIDIAPGARVSASSVFLEGIAVDGYIPEVQTSFNGDANPITFSFEVPAATGTTVIPVVGDAALITFSFNVLPATGETVPPSVGDADPITFSFVVSEPTHTDIPASVGNAESITFRFVVPTLTGSASAPDAIDSGLPKFLTHVIASLGPDSFGVTQYLWDGGENLEYDNHTYLATKGAITISELPAGIEQSDRRLQLSLPLIGSVARHEALRNLGPIPIDIQWIVSEDGGVTWRMTPRRFVGRVSAPRIEGDTYTVEAETYLGDADRTMKRLWSDEDQQREYPGDLGLKYARSIHEGLDIGWPP